MLWSPVYYVSLSLYNAVHGFLTKLQVWSFCICPTRGCWNVFFMAFIGTGIIICLATCVVCQAIPAIVHVHVHVVKSCLLCKFEFVQCSAWFFDQATGLVFLYLSNQRLLECFYGIYRDRHFICSGNMCSLPSHPCHSSCIGSCCDVLLHCLILGLICTMQRMVSWSS